MVRTTQIDIQNHYESAIVGGHIAQDLLGEDLAAIFIVSDDGRMNGSDLINGLNTKTNNEILITGGLAGGSTRYEQTLVRLNDNPSEGKVVSIGLYGQDLKVGHGTMGDWEVFGPEREVTELEYHILYKEFLDKYTSALPGAALLFLLLLFNLKLGLV